MDSGSMKLVSLREEDILSVVQVISAMSDPFVDNTRRMEAYHNFETIKKNLSVDHKLQIGAVLARNASGGWNLAIVHIGFQFLEDSVKFNWQQMKPEQKLLTKNTVFELITNIDASGQSTESFILDGIGKIVVEMIKREWPQQWPTMLQEVEELSMKGPTQLQIIILVFLRFIEDLMQFRSLPQQRHRELSDSLMAIMPEFIGFLVRSLSQALRNNLRLIAINVLRLCSAIGEITQVKSIWTNDGLLIDTLLLQPINDDNLQLEIADFLYCMLSRKYSKKEDVKLVLRLFSEPKYFQVLLQIVSFPGPFNDQSYTSFKKFCETFVAIVLQLSNLEELPAYLEQNKAHFVQYISTLTALTHHHSPVVANTALNAWLTIWGNKVIRERPEVIPTAVSLVQALAKMLLLTKMDEQDKLLDMDFSNQESSFKEFLVGYRLRVSELVRRIAVAKPAELLEFSFSALQLLMDSGVTTEDRWNAVQTIMDNAAKSVAPNVRTQYRQVAFQLVERLMALRKDTAVNVDPEVKSYALSCISRLAHSFIPNPPLEHQALCLEMLDRIVKYDLFLLTSTLSTPETQKDPNSRVGDLHRHATNFFSQFCKYMTKSMVERYDQILASLREVFGFPLTTTDRCALLDGLITITKDCGDATKQAGLASEILSAVAPFWQSAEFSEAVKSIEKFVKFFGLDQPLNAGFEDPVVGQRRKQLFFCSNIIASTFVNMKFSDAPVISLLENSVLLIECFLKIRLPSSVGLLHKTNRDLLKIPATEKRNVLRPVFGSYTPDADPDHVPIERLRTWMQANLESVCRIIGFAGRCLGTQFYQVPNLAGLLKNAVLRYISMPDVVPLFVTRTISRVLLQNFIKTCPVEAYGTVMVPAMKEFCPAVFKMLNANWEDLDVESTEQDEIVRDILLRSFTKDYWSLVLQPLLCDQGVKLTPDDSRDADAMEDDSGASTHSPSPTSSSQPLKSAGKPEDVPEVSPLGNLCLQEGGLSEAIVMTVFNGLRWPDAPASVAFAKFAQMLIPRLTRKDDSPLNAEAVKYIMQSILWGLKVHGQHVINQATLLNLGLHAYFHLKPLFPLAVEEVLRPEHCDLDKHRLAVEQLDGLLFVRPEGKNLYEKRKKAAFKKIVVDHIGKPLSEMQKLQVVIPNLPPLRINKATKKNVTVAQDAEDILGSAKGLFAVNGREGSSEAWCGSKRCSNLP